MFNLFKTKKRRIIFLIIIILFPLFFYIFLLVKDIARYGYDKQNKVILGIKSVIPAHYLKKIVDNVFIVPKLKKEIETLALQVRKFEQGNEGQKFDTKLISLDETKYKTDFFFLPYKKLDTNLGWDAETNSLRAHYLEIYDEYLISISGYGKIVYSNKNNLLTENLKFNDLPNNIEEILIKDNLKLIGIRDLFIFDNQIIISMMIKNNFGITINLYKADFNLKKINFKLLFESKEYWENYNVFSGGRVEKFIDDKILFSIGFSKNYKAPQDKKSLLGKIIAVDLKSKSYELISYGHRNPQGLYFNSNNNLIINTEHGPKGGDEINFNFLNIKEDKNFGWPRVSYGKAYSGEEKFFDKDTFKKSHEELGFIEPFKYFDPSIGISEIIYFEENSFCKFKCLLVSSLRANSVYIFEISDDYKEIVSERRIYLSGNRIRDISYYRDLDLIILLSEEVPAVVSIKKGLN
jgi:hypothetical protein